MRPDPLWAGDAALLLELEPRIDAAVNARAIGIANEVRRQQIAGVRDVVSTYRSVAVHFDPLQADVGAVSEALRRACDAGVVETGGRTIDVPVTYGGEAGPDLSGVADYGGISEADVIRRHSEQSYRVFMLGFVPGFAYMGLVDPLIAAPRRSTPRLKVPAGSVGIAGSQTGVYPRETPGGWQIIGRANISMFDEETASPLCSPGDLVTFRPITAATSGSSSDHPSIATPSRTDSFHVDTRDHASREVVVVTPGLSTTVQDLGRWGRQHEGVPVGGAMDTLSHRLANRCVGNPDTAVTLEVTIQGPELRMESSATLAIAGADLDATVDGCSVALQTPTRVRPGATLRFGARRRGARAYVAFDGGIAVRVRYGHRVRSGDRLPLGTPTVAAAASVTQRASSSSEAMRLRAIPGPQSEFFDERGLDTLARATFTVSPNSNRMAYRLTSMSPIGRATEQEMISDATFAGGVQITPAGDAILLMADRHTTGGYPQIATVISADLPTAGQLAPGDSFTFVLCTRGEAVAALANQEGRLRGQH